MILGAALIAGLISWGGVEASRSVFKPRLFQVRLIDGSIAYEPSLESQTAADTKNAALAFAIQGGALALAMGLVGGLAIRSPAHGLAVGVGAQAAGALAGALATLWLFPIIFRKDYVSDPNDLTTPLLIQAGIWIAIGAVGGSALAIGLQSFRRVLDATFGAILGAFLATGLFRVLHGMLSPPSDPTVIIPTDPPSRLIAAFSVTLLVAVGAATGAIARASDPPPPGPHDESSRGAGQDRDTLPAGMVLPAVPGSREPGDQRPPT